MRNINIRAITLYLHIHNNANGNILQRNDELKHRLKEYFGKLLNVEFRRDKIQEVAKVDGPVNITQSADGTGTSTGGKECRVGL